MSGRRNHSRTLAGSQKCVRSASYQSTLTKWLAVSQRSGAKRHSPPRTICLNTSSEGCSRPPGGRVLSFGPGDAKSMQDQLIVQTQLGRIEDGLPSLQDFEVLGDTPELVASGGLAIFASKVGSVLAGLIPRKRMSSCHGHSFLSKLRSATLEMAHTSELTV